MNDRKKGREGEMGGKESSRGEEGREEGFGVHSEEM